jgi:hypothetical protein
MAVDLELGKEERRALVLDAIHFGCRSRRGERGLSLRPIPKGPGAYPSREVTLLLDLIQNAHQR